MKCANKIIYKLGIKQSLHINKKKFEKFSYRKAVSFQALFLLSSSFIFLSLSHHMWFIVSRSPLLRVVFLFFMFSASVPWKKHQHKASLKKTLQQAGRGEKNSEKGERKVNQPGRQNEWEQQSHACNFPVDFTDRHWNQDWKRKKERFRRKESLLYFNVLCSATIIATTGSSDLWLVLHIPTQKAHRQPTLTRSLFHPHLRALTHSQSNFLFCHSTIQLSHMKHK